MPAKKTTKKVVKKTTKKALVKKLPFSKGDTDLILRTVAKGATFPELHLFLYTAKRCGLDPLAKQIHFQKYNTKEGPQMTIIVGIDGYRAIAERTKTYAGSDDAIYDDGQKYEAGKEPANPSKAKITVYRIVAGQRVGFTATARWKEYYPGDKKGFMWKKMPYQMLAKCAEGLALRKAFPNDLSGIYTQEEMQQAGQVSEMVDQYRQQPPEAPQKPQNSPQKAKTVENDQNTAKPINEPVEAEFEEKVNHLCLKCGNDISDKEAEYSAQMNNGDTYCRECMKSL